MAITPSDILEQLPKSYTKSHGRTVRKLVAQITDLAGRLKFPLADWATHFALGQAVHDESDQRFKSTTLGGVAYERVLLWRAAVQASVRAELDLLVSAHDPTQPWEAVDDVRAWWAVEGRARAVLTVWDSWLRGGADKSRAHFAVFNSATEIEAQLRTWQEDHDGWNSGRDLTHDARVIWSWLSFPVDQREGEAG